LLINWFNNSLFNWINNWLDLAFGLDFPGILAVWPIRFWEINVPTKNNAIDFGKAG